MLQVDDHSHAVLAHAVLAHHGFAGGRARHHAHAILEPFLPAHGALAALENRARRNHQIQMLDDLRAHPLGARGQQLHHRNLAVAVNDHAREAVAVAIEHPVTIGVGTDYALA